MIAYRALAPAKVNLGLFLGPERPSDARHELVTVMQSISLADELTLEPAPAGASTDEVICPGVAVAPQQNLAAAALKAFRAATGWDAPPLLLRIRKEIPVAAGLAGGSADAAAALRLAARASGLGDEELLRELAGGLGADVPAQVRPGRWLASGAGEHLLGLPDPNPPLGLLVLALAVELSTAEVFEEADRLALGRERRELDDRAREMRRALELGAAIPAARDLLANDLQRAAVSLCPDILASLKEAQQAGAEQSLVSGSGPTVVGLFSRANAIGRVERAAHELFGRAPAPICAGSVDAAFGEAVPLAEPR